MIRDCILLIQHEDISDDVKTLAGDIISKSEEFITDATSEYQFGGDDSTQETLFDISHMVVGGPEFFDDDYDYDYDEGELTTCVFGYDLDDFLEYDEDDPETFKPYEAAIAGLTKVISLMKEIQSGTIDSEKAIENLEQAENIIFS